MYCPKCGAYNEDTSKFCSKCGQPLAQAPPVAVPAEAKGRGLPKVGIALVAIALFLGAIFVGVRWYQGYRAEQRAKHYSLGIEALDKHIWDTAVTELKKAGDYLDARSKLVIAEEQLEELIELYDKGISHLKQEEYWDAAYWLRQAADTHPNYKDTNEKLNLARSKNGKILFATKDDDARTWYLVDADGGNQRELMETSAQEWVGATLSADGKRLVVVVSGWDAWDWRQTFYMMNADGSNRQELAGAFFSPDGKRLVMGMKEPEKVTLYLADADGADRQELVAGADSARARFSPDSKRLLIEIERDGRWSLYFADADGRNQRELVSDAESVRAYLSPDGSRMVIVVERDNEESLYLADADGSNRQELVAGVDYALANFSPDGRWLLLDIRRDNKDSLYLADADGSNRQELVTGVSNAWGFFSPDGRWLGIEIERDDGWSLYLADADGRNQRELVSGAEDAWAYFSFSPDSKWMLIEERDELNSLYLANTKTGSMDELVSEAEYVSAAFSPDGRKIAFTDYREYEPSALCVADAADGNVIRLIEGVYGVIWAHPQE